MSYHDPEGWTPQKRARASIIGFLVGLALAVVIVVVISYA